jgi:hypothetical protein
MSSGTATNTRSLRVLGRTGRRRPEGRPHRRHDGGAGGSQHEVCALRVAAAVSSLRAQASRHATGLIVRQAPTTLSVSGRRVGRRSKHWQEWAPLSTIDWMPALGLHRDVTSAPVAGRPALRADRPQSELAAPAAVGGLPACWLVSGSTSASWLKPGCCGNAAAFQGAHNYDGTSPPATAEPSGFTTRL